MRNRLAVLLSVLVSMVFLTTPADATVWWLQYSDRSGGKCLAMPYTAETEYAEQATCVTPVGSGADKQLFQLVSLASGNSWIVSQHSGKCLAVLFETPLEGVPVQQVTCGSVNLSDQWQISVVSEQPNGSMNLLFRNARTARCMTGSPGPTMYTCDSANVRQVWHQHLREGGGKN